MAIAIGFDVYGTLVDPLGMSEHLGPLAGAQAERFAQLWREKQLEYSFRRAVMRAYVPFSTCTRQALEYVARALGVTILQADADRLMESYAALPAFEDVVPALARLRAIGHKMFAFSNGEESVVRNLLGRTRVVQLLDGVLSVDDLKTFKPNPDVYRYLVARMGQPEDQTWLVSSNSFDVIGAKAAGLRAAWVRRRPDAIFDSWDIDPDLTVASLVELPPGLAAIALKTD